MHPIGTDSFVIDSEEVRLTTSTSTSEFRRAMHQTGKGPRETPADDKLRRDLVATETKQERKRMVSQIVGGESKKMIRGERIAEIKGFKLKYHPGKISLLERLALVKKNKANKIPDQKIKKKVRGKLVNGKMKDTRVGKRRKDLRIYADHFDHDNSCAAMLVMIPDIGLEDGDGQAATVATHETLVFLEPEMSPRQGARVAMYKTRFAETIKKAQLEPYGRCDDDVEEEVRRQKGQVSPKINEVSSDMMTERATEREAARVAIERMEKPVDIYDSHEAVKELENMCRSLFSCCRSSYSSRRPRYLLPALGLFLKDGAWEDED